MCAVMPKPSTTLPTSPPETANGFLDVIISETDRMAHIVQDLLTLSKFDYGHHGNEYDPLPAE